MGGAGHALSKFTSKFSGKLPDTAADFKTEEEISSFNEGLKSAETEESNMQKRDNVSFGGIIYGKLRKKFAEEDSAGVIETAYEVMNSEEYKNSEEELRRIVMSKRGEGERVDISDNAKNNNADIHNANSNADAVDNSTNNDIINDADNAGNKEQTFSVDESNILNEGDGEFNSGDEDTISQDNSSIDTDNALSENNNINVDKVDEVGGVGSSPFDAGNINKVKGNNVINGENDIANGDEVGYKGEEDEIDGFKLIDGKIGGKIPVEDFKNIRQNSIHIPQNIKKVLIMILGKYTDDENCYISKAIANNAMYFDMGKVGWKAVKEKYKLNDEEMFEYFNKPAIKDAIDKGIIFKFSHNPKESENGFLYEEWKYIKRMLELTDDYLKGDVFV